MSTFQKAELTGSVHHIERFSKSGIPILNSEFPGKNGRKEEEEGSPWQSVMRFMQTQQLNKTMSLNFCIKNSKNGHK